MPLDEVPVGPDERANVEVRKWGEPRELVSAKEHFELGEAIQRQDRVHIGEKVAVVDVQV